MRKLVAILLIAVIACVEVDTTPKEEVSDFNELLDLLDLDVNSVELSLGDFLNGVKGFFGNLWNKVKDCVEFLKKNGVWDQLVSLVKTGARYGATKLCGNYFDESICNPIIDVIFKLF